jgi:hypothetical protein
MRRIGTVALASAVICVGLLFPHPAYGQVFGPGFSDPGGGDAATSKLAEPAQSEPTNNNAQSGSL